MSESTKANWRSFFMSFGVGLAAVGAAISEGFGSIGSWATIVGLCLVSVTTASLSREAGKR